jgi:hypothetical protein
MPSRSGTVKQTIGSMAHQEHPIDGLPANSTRWNGDWAKLIEVLPNVFLADKNGAQQLHHHVANFAHILVRDSAQFAAGANAATSVNLRVQNQASGLPAIGTPQN